MISFLSFLKTAVRRAEGVLKLDLRYIIRGGFWLSIAQIVVTGSGLLISILFANFVSPETYGTYRYIMGFWGMFAVFSLPGIATAMTQAAARGVEGDFLNATRTRMKWGAAGALLIGAIGAYYFFMGNTVLGSAFLLLAAFLPFNDPLNTYDSLLYGRKAISTSTNYFLITALISTIAVASAVYFSGELLIIIAAYLISWTLVRLFFFLKTLRTIRPDAAREPSLIKDGKHLTFLGIINTVASYLDRIILFQLAGPATLAVYSIAVAPVDQIRNLIARGGSLLALPKLATQNKENIQKRIFPQMLQLTFILAVSAFAYVIVAPWLFTHIFPKYIDSIPYSQLFALSLLPLASFLPAAALNAKMEKRKLLYYNTATSLFQISAISVLTFLFGLTGIIVARIASRVFEFCLSLFLVRKTINVQY